MRSFKLTYLPLELLPTYRPTEKKIRCDAKHVVLGKYCRLCVYVCVCVCVCVCVRAIQVVGPLRRSVLVDTSCSYSC
jgi:hypothetical protein